MLTWPIPTPTDRVRNSLDIFIIGLIRTSVGRILGTIIHDYTRVHVDHSLPLNSHFTTLILRTCTQYSRKCRNLSCPHDKRPLEYLYFAMISFTRVDPVSFYKTTEVSSSPQSSPARAYVSTSVSQWFCAVDPCEYNIDEKFNLPSKTAANNKNRRLRGSVQRPKGTYVYEISLTRTVVVFLDRLSNNV